MKKFRLENDYLEIFPETKIGVILCKNLNNRVKDQDKYAGYLKECQKLATRHIANEDFTANPVVHSWREAFYKFKTKKGARCSIEALLKRVSKGNDIGTIIPLVDIYNGISLKYGVPIGGEDIDKMEGDIRLTIADGSEAFVTYGSDKSEPPSPGEIVYKDDAGAICRCYNWRESVRTMLTEDTTHAFMILESVDQVTSAELVPAMEELQNLIQQELGAQCESFILDKDNSEIVIDD